MLFFFYGQNSYAAREQIRELAERFSAKHQSSFGVERFDAQSLAGGESNAEKLISALTNLPLLESSRLVIVEDLLGNKSLAEAVLSALKEIPESTVVVIWEAKPDERLAVFKELKSIAKTTKFDPLKPPELAQWLIKYTTAQGGSINMPTAQLLINQAGSDQWRLSNEVLKLVNFKPTITPEAIKEFIEPSFQNTIFDLVEAITKSQTSRALKLYQGLRDSKAEPLYILSMISWQLRNLVVAKAAEVSKSNPSAQQIASDFKMNPFVVRKAQEAVRSIDLKKLKAAHSLLITADHKLKTSAMNPDLVLEQLIMDISTRLE